ncbi:hypothetical protein TNCV_1652041 [Trichonephila clavipes]|nr:hypothetical protein TNCV_1652041 [Trichonephila clavipes]
MERKEYGKLLSQTILQHVLQSDTVLGSNCEAESHKLDSIAVVSDLAIPKRQANKWQKGAAPNGYRLPRRR